MGRWGDRGWGDGANRIKVSTPFEKGGQEFEGEKIE
jgi:hypothetical protein